MELCNAKRWRRLERQKKNNNNNNFARAEHFLLHFFAVIVHDNNVKLSSYTCITNKCNN